RDAQRQSLFSDLYKTDPAKEHDTDASSLEVSNRIQTIILNETTRILADALISIKTANPMTGIVSDGTRSTGNTHIPVTQ
ncbi:MAG TPA: hypothetical protein DCS41_00645, partial [Gammaproteobacteria bacterium]|nr:hypothetical protein [Gammaproteobacteria bacterium]